MLTKSDTVNRWQNWLNIEIPRFLLQTLLLITNVINCLIYVLLLPSLSDKVTLFQLYKPRMDNLFCYFNFVEYFLFPRGRWQILVFSIRTPCACPVFLPSYWSEYTLLCSHLCWKAEARQAAGCRFTAGCRIWHSTEDANNRIFPRFFTALETMVK